MIYELTYWSCLFLSPPLEWTSWGWRSLPDLSAGLAQAHKTVGVWGLVGWDIS